MFLLERGPERFRAISGFGIGVDASAAVLRGAQIAVDWRRAPSEILAFVFNGSGVTPDLSLQGSQVRQSDM